MPCPFGVHKVKKNQEGSEFANQISRLSASAQSRKGVYIIWRILKSLTIT